MFCVRSGWYRISFNHSYRERTARIVLSERIDPLIFPLLYALALGTTVHTEASKLVIESSDSARSRQRAAMEEEQWNDTRNLRQKVNKRTKKEQDKADTTFDSHDKCEQSTSINAYWRPSTLHYLGRRAGRVTIL